MLTECTAFWHLHPCSSRLQSTSLTMNPNSPGHSSVGDAIELVGIYDIQERTDLHENIQGGYSHLSTDDTFDDEENGQTDDDDSRTFLVANGHDVRQRKLSYLDIWPQIKGIVVEVHGIP
jgi:hypothetical protein